MELKGKRQKYVSIYRVVHCVPGGSCLVRHEKATINEGAEETSAISLLDEATGEER